MKNLYKYLMFISTAGALFCWISLPLTKDWTYAIVALAFNGIQLICLKKS